jgi:predicted enzyme related to lactoylglutathione lyase
MPKLSINIDVDDIERGVAFYTTAFELRVERRLGPDIVELGGMPTPIFLLKKHAGTFPFSGATATRGYDRHWTPVHLDFLSRNIDRAVERAESAGALREGPVQSYEWGKIAYFSDPFGHGFCVLQFSDLGYDALVDA